VEGHCRLRAGVHTQQPTAVRPAHQALSSASLRVLGGPRQAVHGPNTHSGSVEQKWR
jgi:hypothetical protein